MQIEIKIDKTKPTAFSVQYSPKVYEIPIFFTGGDDDISTPVAYNYYLNNNLIKTLDIKEYIYQSLSDNTSYQLKIEAVNKAGLKETWSETTSTKNKLTCTTDYISTNNVITISLNCNDISRAQNILYSIDNINWQSSNVFTNLNEGSTYTVYTKLDDSLGSIVSISNLTTYTKGVPKPTIAITSGSKTDSSSNWYTSASVGLTITSNKTGSTNLVTEYRTKVNSGVWSDWQTSTNISLTAEGTHEIEFRNKNNYTNEITNGDTYQVYIDRSAPAAPSLNIASGTAGNSPWYKSNVAVKITAGSDNASGVQKVTYTISGAQVVANETQITSGNNVTITAEGKSTITAYTYDKAGNKSIAKTIEINKDTIGPVFAGVSDTSTTNAAYDKRAGITISDATSGVNSTTDFLVSPTSNLVSGNNTITYTASDKAGNTTVKTRVIYYSGGVCFVAGTPVLTNQGYKNIEDIKIGDKVYSMNTDTMKTEIKTVTELFTRRTVEIYKITVNNTIIETTANHPFYVVNKGWINAEDLKIEDEFYNLNGQKIKIQKIEIINHEKLVDVYNFEVEDNHNYFVAPKDSHLLKWLEDYPILPYDNQKAVLVHNYIT